MSDAGRIRPKQRPEPTAEPTAEPAPVPEPAATAPGARRSERDRTKPPKPPRDRIDRGPPAVHPAAGLGAPAGTVPRGQITGGFPWANINRWDGLVLPAAVKHRVDPAILKAMLTIESGGRADAADAHGAIGLMQIKPEYWAARAKPLGYDLRTPAGQVGMAAAIIGGDVPGVPGATPQERFLASYYPIKGGLDARGESGHTQRMYLHDIALFSAAIAKAGPGLPQPTGPSPAADPTAVVMGGPHRPVTYGFQADAGLDYYDYGIGRLRPVPTVENWGQLHTGIDLLAAAGAPLYAPLAGTVVCAGTGDGPGAWGQGCAAFSAVDGVGRFEVVADADPNLSIIYGHCRTVRVRPGDRVTAGQPVATVGTYNAPHNHLEVRRWHGADYHIVEPVAALRALMGGPPMPTGPAQQTPLREIDVAGTDKIVRLQADIGFRQLLTPPGPNRSRRPMRTTGTRYHETGNPGRGTGALHHAKWQNAGTPGHPDGKIGVHFYVDDKEVVQTIPIDERGVHSGDHGNGVHIGVEQCVNADADLRRARRNAICLHAAILRDVLGKTGTEAMWPHHAGGGCPATINAAGAWPMVEAEVDRLVREGNER